jgi:hypothetical protein
MKERLSGNSSFLALASAKCNELFWQTIAQSRKYKDDRQISVFSVKHILKINALQISTHFYTDG